MLVTVTLNPKHESDRRYSFLEVLAASGNVIELTYTGSDLLDPEAPVSLENLGVHKYLQKLSHSVVFVHDDGRREELYKKVNIFYERRPQ